MSLYLDVWYSIGWYLNVGILMGAILMPWQLNVWYFIGWYLNAGILMGVIFFTQYSKDYILIRAHRHVVVVFRRT